MDRSILLYIVVPLLLLVVSLSFHSRSSTTLKETRQEVQFVKNVVAEAEKSGTVALPTALSKAEELLSATRLTVEDRLELLEVAGSLARKLKRLQTAEKHHRESLKIKGERGATAFSLLRSYVDIVTDLQRDGRPKDGLAVILEAESTIAKSLPNEAVSLLLRLGARLFTCMGELEMAQKRIEKSITLHVPMNLGETLQYRSILQRRLVEFGPGSSERVKLERLVDGLTSRVMKTSRYADPMQLPHHFVKGLESKAWHEPTLSFKGALLPMVKLLERADLVEALFKEYDALRQTGRLRVDADCIHEPVSGKEWSRYEVTAVWNLIGSADRSCSVKHSPVACQLLSELQELGGPTVLRLGFSAVEAGAWIRPHYGASNTKIKLHLGVRVPDGGCATMRVGTERRAWVQGKVLVFDDSFEHEVKNSCDSTRVVLQVVVRHPGIKVKEATPLVTEDH